MTMSRALSIGFGVVATLSAAIWSPGCATGSSTGGVPGTGGATGAGGQGGSAATSVPDCVPALVATLKPELDVCRSCHVPGGIADGAGFLLTQSSAEDAALLRMSWQAIGADLLAYPAEAGGKEHTGGPLWSVGDPAYETMSAITAAFADPDACSGLGADGGELTAVALLESSHGGHAWNAFCEGKPDDTPLPVDPRTLVKPGVNDGKAAYMNAFWVDCHVDAPAADAAPKTCGDFRGRLQRGKEIMEDGKMWFFGGNYTDATLVITSETYNGLWFQWGLGSRPSNFDELVAERWGVPLGSKRNPYPLPGEDPNATSGGSGQLPVALTQLREADGRYTGRMSFNCNWCHSGKVGDPSDGPGLGALYGNGNSLADLSAAFGYFTGGITAAIPLAANKVRGTGDVLLYPAIAALDYDRALHYNPSVALAPSQGSVDFPPWWNVGHRTRRFHDGSFAMDDGRPVMGFFIPIFTASRFLNLDLGRQWIEERDQDVQTWLESLEAPAYPGPIDSKLATAGAVLFHNKDLWAPELGNQDPKPAGGNGSCAGCHGVYAPRFAGNTRYLDTPELEGIGAHVVPIDVIGTDPARFQSLNEGLKEMLKWTWWAYGTNTEPGACFGTVEPGGYLAPPLHGVWATAPYFHNGSVPNVWEVLKPSDRKAIWRRVSAPAPAGTSSFMGFDTNLARAYDRDRLGWKYDELGCDDTSTQPWLECSPAVVETNAAVDALLSGGFEAFWFLWNAAPQPVTDADLEQRKIYNTTKYSQGNGGHQFTSVLTDVERKALVEYLKTL